MTDSSSLSPIFNQLPKLLIFTLKHLSHCGRWLLLWPQMNYTSNIHAFCSPNGVPKGMGIVCLGMQASSMENFKIVVKSAEDWSAFCYQHELQFETMSVMAYFSLLGWTSPIVSAGYMLSYIYSRFSFSWGKHGTIKDLLTLAH